MNSASSDSGTPPDGNSSATDLIMQQLLKQMQKDNKKDVQSNDLSGYAPPFEPDPDAVPSVIEKDPVKQGYKKWSDLPCIGKVIENTRFICFKTPLDMALPTNPDYNAFTTQQLLQEHLPSRGRTLGMVVDLTEGYQFYNPYNAFESKEIKHLKLFCPGVDALPRQEKVDAFNDHVVKFIKDTEGCPDKNGEDVLVGVHCNTGISMTAYFVIQFMITKMLRNQTKAIVAFETARGVPITSDLVKNALKELQPLKAKQFLKTKVGKKKKK